MFKLFVCRLFKGNYLLLCSVFACASALFANGSAVNYTREQRALLTACFKEFSLSVHKSQVIWIEYKRAL